MVHLAGVPDAPRMGAAILGEVLSPAGFTIQPAAEGRGSGGEFAAGRFIRGGQYLEFQYRADDIAHIAPSYRASRQTPPGLFTGGQRQLPLFRSPQVDSRGS